jgi:hypothetical protein
VREKKDARKEAKRRWGPSAIVTHLPEYPPGFYVEASEFVTSPWGEGETWEAAFADADRRDNERD